MAWKGARKGSGRALLQTQLAAGFRMITRISNILSELPGEIDLIFQNEFPYLCLNTYFIQIPLATADV